MDKEIEQIKFQLKSIANTIDSQKHPVEYLTLQFDLSEPELNLIFEIFDEYAGKLYQKDSSINWVEFESKLKSTLQIGYQDVKTIISVFYDADKYVDVCKNYAKQFPCMEFNKINNNL